MTHVNIATGISRIANSSPSPELQATIIKRVNIVIDQFCIGTCFQVLIYKSKILPRPISSQPMHSCWCRS